MSSQDSSSAGSFMTYFLVLGLPFAAPLEDVKKAYRSKALEYHPDRNPNGAEVFKRVHAAYENIVKNQSKIQIQKQQQTTGGFFSNSTTTSWQQKTSPAQSKGGEPKSDPLIPEEELFADCDLGRFTTGMQPGRRTKSSPNMTGSNHYYYHQQQQQGATKKPFRQRNQIPNPNNNTSNSSSTTGGPPTPPPRMQQQQHPGNIYTTDPKYYFTSEYCPEFPPAKKQQHSTQTPAASSFFPGGIDPNPSAYDPFDGNDEALRDFLRQQKHFEEMEEKKMKMNINSSRSNNNSRWKRRNKTSSSEDNDEEEKKQRKQNWEYEKEDSDIDEEILMSAATTNMDGVAKGRQRNEEVDESDEVKKFASTTTTNTIPPSSQSFFQRCANTNTTAAQNRREMIEKEYQHLKAKKHEEIQNTNTLENIKMELEKEARKKKIEQETKEEWNRLQEEIERGKRKEREEASQKEAHQRVAMEQQEKLADQTLRAVAAERRAIRRDYFSKIVPSESNITKMGEPDLFSLLQVLQQTVKIVEKQMKFKEASALCIICGAKKRMHRNPLSKDDATFRIAPPYQCEHAPTCTSCLPSTAECPICGGERRGT